MSRPLDKCERLIGEAERDANVCAGQTCSRYRTLDIQEVHDAPGESCIVYDVRFRINQWRAKQKPAALDETPDYGA